MVSRALIAPAIACGLIWCSGCGGGPVKPSLTIVKGIVKLNGSVVEEGTVNFASPSTGNGATAELDGDGTFVVSGGMVPGDYKVTITPPRPTPDNPVVPKSKIPQKYRSNAKTDLMATISASQNELQFDLKP